MNRSLILACGDPSRSDASVAVQVARGLAAGCCDPQTQIFFCRTWSFELADLLRKYDQVIFIDASNDFAPGSVSVNRVSPYPGHVKNQREFSPSRLLTFCEQRFAEAPKVIYQIWIGTDSLGPGARPSSRVRPAIPEALNRIKAILSGVTFPEAAQHAQAVGA